MKALLSVLMMFSLSACILQAQTQPQPATPEQLALASAEQNDTALLYLPIRGNPLPGVNEAETERAVKTCGQKPMQDFRDYYTADEKQGTMDKIAFAEQYNQAMLKLCLK